MFEGISIRRYEPGYEEGVVSLWRECGLVVTWNDPRRDIARKLTVQPELFLVAVQGSEVVGSVMAGYDGHRGWLNYLAVAPGLRKRGLGKRLVQEALAGLSVHDCPKLNVQVRSSNRGVVEFYKRIGFKVDDVVSLGRRIERD